MGVPFVTLAGKHFVSRMGITILNNAGLADMVAQTVDDYVDMVAALANDRERLRHVRAGLRERAAVTPLMDEAAFARDMDDAFRAMWRTWCAP